MKSRVHEVTCSICGGTGVGDMHAVAAEWIAGREVVHADPRICYENLRIKAEQMEAEKLEKENNEPA